MWIQAWTYAHIVHGSVWVQAWTYVYIVHGSVSVKAWTYVYIVHGSVWVQVSAHGMFLCAAFSAGTCDIKQNVIASGL